MTGRLLPRDVPFHHGVFSTLRGLSPDLQTVVWVTADGRETHIPTSDLIRDGYHLPLPPALRVSEGL